MHTSIWAGCWIALIIARGCVVRHANQSIRFHQAGNSMACYKENASLTAYPVYSVPPSVCLFIRYIKKKKQSPSSGNFSIERRLRAKLRAV